VGFVSLPALVAQVPTATNQP